ncbi:MAG: DoxX family protein [Pseudomonadota bacterium]
MSVARPSAARGTSPASSVPSADGLLGAVAPFGEPLIRATIGLFLVPHGAQKLFGWFGGHGLEATGQFFAAKLGLPPSMALAAGLIEVVGGLALAAGLFTRIAAALVAGLMAVAVFKVHLGAGFFWTSGGIEYPAMWGLVALAFVLQGGGRYSLDALVARR